MQIHDTELSQGYREAKHPEPSAALDAHILAAARAAVVSRRRRPAWFGWAVPLSTTLVLVLGISLLFRVQLEAPETMREVQSPLPARPLARTEMTSPDRETPVLPQAAKLSKPATQPAKPLPLAFPDRETAVADATMEKAADHADVAAPPTLAMPQPSPKRAAAQDNRAEALSAAPAFSAGMSRMKSAAPSAEETPEQWVEAIRLLLRQGNIDAARTRLEALRKRHPEFPLPPDLEPALTNGTPQSVQQKIFPPR